MQPAKKDRDPTADLQWKSPIRSLPLLLFFRKGFAIRVDIVFESCRFNSSVFLLISCGCFNSSYPSVDLVSTPKKPSAGPSSVHSKSSFSD